VPKDIITMMMHAPFGPEARVAEPAQPAPTPVQGGPAAMDSVIAAPARDSAIVPAAPKPGSKPAPVAPPPAVRTPKALLSPLPSEPGIHLLAGENELQLLEPTAFTSGRTSNVLASALTSGLAPVKMKAVVSARQAAIRVEDTSAEFYFVFERTSAGLGSSAQGWGTVSSPNEFTLIRLDKKSDRREATTGSFSALGSSTGTESKSIVPTKFTRLKPGVYRVVPLAPLAPGEYAFFPASAYGPNAAGSRLFDFGVDTATSAGVNR
jgi:hypothetical protein